MNYFVAGIDTAVGKTFVSAMLTLGLRARYWKPVQAGTVEITDKNWVKKYTDLPDSHFVDEAYLLETPKSPHFAAELDGVVIEKENLCLPEPGGDLVIEGAGGLMVPLSNDLLYLDLLKRWHVKVVLVVKLYLGCINHTLLSINVLESIGAEIHAVVFNGEGFEEAKDFITEYCQRKNIAIAGYIGFQEEISPSILQECFDGLAENFHI